MGPLREKNTQVAPNRSLTEVIQGNISLRHDSSVGLSNSCPMEIFGWFNNKKRVLRGYHFLSDLRAELSRVPSLRAWTQNLDKSSELR